MGVPSVPAGFDGIACFGFLNGFTYGNFGDPGMFAMTLWAFTHGIIQLAMVKGGDLTRHGIAVSAFTDNAFVLLRRMAQGAPHP